MYRTGATYNHFTEAIRRVIGTGRGADNKNSIDKIRGHKKSSLTQHNEKKSQFERTTRTQLM